MFVSWECLSDWENLLGINFLAFVFALTVENALTITANLSKIVFFQFFENLSLMLSHHAVEMLGRYFQILFGVMISAGWLEPLLGRIAENFTHVVCPTIDVISDDDLGYQYFGSDQPPAIGIFSWDMIFGWKFISKKETELRNRTDPLRYKLKRKGIWFRSKSGLCECEDFGNILFKIPLRLWLRVFLYCLIYLQLINS